MANSREILEGLIDEGVPGLGDSYRALKKAPGLTDEIAERVFLKDYANTREELKKRAEDLEGVDVTIPTIQAIASAVTGKEGDEALKIFLDDFQKKQNVWKKTLTEKNPSFGERGWEYVKQAWRQAQNDKMNADIAQARNEAVNDGTIAGAITRAVFPRATERLANGGDIKAKDILLDIGENGLMAIPGAGFTGVAGRLGAKALPGVARSVARVGASKGLGTRAVSSLGNMARNIAGNAVVPLATEILDANIYEDGEGMDDRVDFSVGDVATGAAVNQLVNRGLYRIANPLQRMLSGELTQGSGGGLARQILENLGKDVGEQGKKFSDRVNIDAAVKDIVEKGMLSPGEVKAAQMGNFAFKNSLTKAESDAAKATKAVLDDIANGKISPMQVADVAMSGTTEGLSNDVIDVIAKNPKEFVNYAAWAGKGPGSATKAQKVLNAVNKEGAALAINKAGREEYTKSLFNSLPALGEEIKKEREEKRKAPKKRQASEDVKVVIESTPDLDERDVKYLTMVRDNPDIMTYGNNDADFKLWLLEKGHKLLNETAAGRPLWEIR